MVYISNVQRLSILQFIDWKLPYAILRHYVITLSRTRALENKQTRDNGAATQDIGEAICDVQVQDLAPPVATNVHVFADCKKRRLERRYARDFFSVGALVKITKLEAQRRIQAHLAVQKRHRRCVPIVAVAPVRTKVAERTQKPSNRHD